ncbi:MAG: gamma-glutamyl-gamma-aminobutyrate hydrolase family protein [Bacteroidales bacterium]|nr:gamma-glutamyl-gamma-aminobutyrate hydrolase family protein [Bacteroidales bacterium]
MRRITLLLSVCVAVVSCHRNAPVIGITSFRYHNFVAVGSEYSDAIAGSGAIAMILPYSHSEAEAAAIINNLDGIVFIGGTDVPPGWYGEEILNETVQLDPLRDRSDSLLARAALASGKPVLGVCRGSQLLNVMLGGTMYQDIPTQVPGGAAHTALLKAAIEPDSFIDKIFDQDSLTLYCGHHQAVKDLAPGVKVAARTDDGIVEAWECGQVWGVQFHPEGLLPYLPEYKLLFDAFVERCK